MVTTMMARRVMATMATRTPTSSRNIWDTEIKEEVVDVISLLVDGGMAGVGHHKFKQLG